MSKMYNVIDRDKVTLDTVVYEAVLFNEDTTEATQDAVVFGGNPDGIINVTDSPYAWAENLWDTMYANDWHPKEVNMTEDTTPYKELTKFERDAYDKVIAALIFNDSAQTRNLASNMVPWITDGNILMCLARQTYEEANHSRSYDVMVKDVSPNRNVIYLMHKTDPFVAERNRFLENMYSDLAYNKGHGATVRQILKAMLANNILEGLMFYGGFVFIWVLGDKLKGSAQMISFIARDEKMHVSLFRQMITSSLRAYPGVDKKEVEEIAYKMVSETVDFEIKWLKYITGNNIARFNDTVIERYFRTKGDELMIGMGFSPIYNGPSSPLIEIEKQYSNPNKIKTNFLEGAAKTYDSKKLSMEDF